MYISLFGTNDVSAGEVEVVNIVEVLAVVLKLCIPRVSKVESDIWLTAQT